MTHKPLGVRARTPTMRSHVRCSKAEACGVKNRQMGGVLKGTPSESGRGMIDFKRIIKTHRFSLAPRCSTDLDGSTRIPRFVFSLITHFAHCADLH